MEWLSQIPMCSFYGKPWLSGMHILGNLMVWAAYMAIPIAIEIVRRRRGIEFNALAAMFAMFIALCGIGHLLTIMALITNSDAWHWVNTANDLLTGVVSITTAIYCFLLIPTMMRFPTPGQYELAKETIQVYRDLELWRNKGKPKRA